MQSVSKEEVRAVMRRKNSRKECQRYLKLVQDMHSKMCGTSDRWVRGGGGITTGSAQSPLCLQW